MPIGVHDLGVSRLRSTRTGFGGSYFFKWLPSQSNTVRCHWTLFAPFSTQWFSSGKTRSCEGTPRRWSAVKRSEEHTSELQSLMRISYAVLCLKQKTEHKE